MTRAKGRPGKLTLQHQAREGSHTLTLFGELDLATAPELEATIARLCRDGAREIVLDLRELSLIDSTGWRAMMTGQKLCERHGCDFALIRVHGQVRRLTEPTSLAQRLSLRGRGLAKRLARRAPPSDTPFDLSRPSFAISFDLDPGAPRSARNYVADVIRADASQDLREAVKLLTSELVTRAVQQRRSEFAEAVELRVWTRVDLLRVELQGPSELLLPPPEPGGPLYDMILLDKIADRWSIDTGRDTGCVWFEIDREAPGRAARGHPSFTTVN